MDNEQQSQPSIASAPAPVPPMPAVPTPEPPPQSPPLASVPTPPTPVPKAKQVNSLYIGIGALLCIGIVITGILYAKGTGTTNTAPTPVAITPTEMPTPTPPPNVARIATTSAFMAFKEEIASFSATLNTFTLQDSTLAPPSLDLELNLTK